MEGVLSGLALPIHNRFLENVRQQKIPEKYKNNQKAMINRSLIHLADLLREYKIDFYTN